MSSKRTVEATPKIHIRDFSSPTVAVYRHGVKLDITYPYFGGKRHWFLCCCGRRVSTLYQESEYSLLKCRVCCNLRYQSQGFSGNARHIWRLLDKVERIETVFNGLQRVKLFHNGQPTRRFSRFLKDNNKINLLGHGLGLTTVPLAR